LNLPLIIDVSKTTREPYGQLKSHLFEKCAPQKNRKNVRLSQLLNPMDGSNLGVTENDIWIAAQAFERNLVLVSADKHMKTLVSLVREINLEDWTCPFGQHIL